MPNWVMNELTCTFQTNEEFNAFKEKANLEGLFNSFFPMPAVLEGTTSPNRTPEEWIKSVNRSGSNFITLEEIINSGDNWNSEIAKGILQNLKAYEETNFYNWYDWNLANWGVKWEASNCKIKEAQFFNTLVFSFDTAWNTPEHFVIELSKMYPNATFEMVSGSIENDMHYEFTCEDGKYEETCSYETFREAVEDGKWGGMSEWEYLLEESEEV